MLGIFKSARVTATEAGIASIRPIVATIQHTHGLPSRFWMDPYVLGFFSFMIGHYAKLATKGSIKAEALGQVLCDVLNSVSNLNGIALSRRTTQLALEEDPPFNRGADDAATICFYSMRSLKNEPQNALVRAASEIAMQSNDAGNSESERRAYIGSLMLMLTLMKEVEGRLAVD